MLAQKLMKLSRAWRSQARWMLSNSKKNWEFLASQFLIKPQRKKSAPKLLLPLLTMKRKKSCAKSSLNYKSASKLKNKKLQLNLNPVTTLKLTKFTKMPLNNLKLFLKISLCSKRRSHNQRQLSLTTLLSATAKINSRDQKLSTHLKLLIVHYTLTTLTSYLRHI